MLSKSSNQTIDIIIYDQYIAALIKIIPKLPWFFKKEPHILLIEKCLNFFYVFDAPEIKVEDSVLEAASRV